MDMLSTKQIGTITEYECALALMKLGYSVSIPIGENSPYDLIVDICDRLYKIQCKHARSSPGGFEFSCESTRINATSTKVVRYSPNQVDYFATMFNDICYLVPIQLCRTSCKLRLEPTKSNQQSNILWAPNFEASHIIHKLIDPTIEDPICHNMIKQSPSMYRWITDGSNNAKIGVADPVPAGFRYGRVM